MEINIPDEINQLRDLLRMLWQEKICPPVSSLSHLLDGRAGNYLETMASMGIVEIDSRGRIIG